METGQSARLLVAARPQAHAFILQVLQADFSLEFCDSLADAKKLLSSGRFDLVLCTLQFDSSRMFDLLRHVRSDPAIRDIPFVAIKLAGGILSDDTVRHVLKAAHLMGADECINLADWRRQFGDEQAYDRLRTTLRSHCSH